MSKTTWRCAAILAALLALPQASAAAGVDPATINPNDVGPPTPYGETPAEAAAKKIAFERNYMENIQRNPEGAYEQYISRDYCDHGHLATRGKTDCVGWQASLTDWERRHKAPLKPGELVEIPTMASVDGEMVTMYGEGVDIFRVHNGKITDHWDASPPAAASIPTHAAGFTAWVLGVRNGPPPGESGPSTTAVTITQDLIDNVNLGPVSPYGETPAETANKLILMEYTHMSQVLGDAPAAVEMFMSKDYCNHGHISTRGLTDCAGYDETLASAIKRAKHPKIGDAVEVPTMATVDGEMVTMYGRGVDIFRVHDGKITDHWDASPPAAANINAHKPVFVERMVRTLAGESIPFGASNVGTKGAGKQP